MTTAEARLDQAARALALVLEKTGKRVVFAESCTAGMVSAALGRIPGISRYLLGSWVTYGTEIKTAWLEIPSQLLQEKGPVSAEVCEAMARQALEKTPGADVAASITGHLGPDAPLDLDGVIYIGIALRTTSGCVSSVERRIISGKKVRNLRKSRQLLASQAVLMMVRSLLYPAAQKEKSIHAKPSNTRTGHRSKK